MTFELDADFIAQYVGQQPKWGPIGYVTYKRTYARDLDKIYPRHRALGEAAGLVDNEEFWLTLVRVTEGTVGIIADHCRALRLPWDPKRAQQTGQEMYRLMWEFKFSPPGRGLWMMGAPIVEKIGSACLNNCAFLSSKDIDVDFSGPFCALMDFSMLGVGVGGDTRGAGKVVIQKPKVSQHAFTVDDSREGWVEVLRVVLDAYVGRGVMPAAFDYSEVRESGAAINGFGGTASGPGPLREMVEAICGLLDARIGEVIMSSDIVDLFNLVGRCVVAGNVRRSAELMLGEPVDEGFLELKDRDKHAAAIDSHRWASNNSILAKVGQKYDRVAKRTAKNGEPGYFWLKNAQDYGRMSDPPNYKDAQVLGTNPCQPAWANVLTPRGISTIGDIEIGDQIWSGSAWTKVTNKWSTGIKPVKAYRTRAGTFFGTDQHRVVSQGVKVEVQYAESIDRALGPANVGRDNRDQQVVVDGLVLGDGTYHHASGRTFLCAGPAEVEEYRREFGELIGEYRPGVSSHTYEVTTSFDTLPHTYEREIPQHILRGTHHYKTNFLRGLYTANGSVVASRVTLKAASFKIIESVQQMLSSIGIGSYYTVNKPTDIEHHNGVYTSKQSYDLNIGTREGRELFAHHIGFVQQHKNDRLRATLDAAPATRTPKISFEVAEVEDISIEEVFDITVESEDHVYWSGGLLVSNCSEQSLFDRELCCLVETYPFHHDGTKDYKRTIKFAYLYAKAVTLVPTHDPKTNAVTMKNRRIGCSMSGIVQAMSKFGRRGFLDMCDEVYAYICELDKDYSGWLCVPESIKKTSVKPSGTVSLLCQATPGIHHPIAEYYWRVIRFATNSKMLPALRAAGYMAIEIDQAKEPNTTAVYFPVKEEGYERGQRDVSMWEQLEIAAAMQAHWADNQVSATVQFDKVTEGPQIARALELYETRLKGVSFLPHGDHGYEHAPYQPISETEYLAAKAAIGVLDLSRAVHETTDAFCDGEKCVMPVPSA